MEEKINKITNTIRTIVMWMLLVFIFCTGVYQIAVYGIPLFHHERDVKRVLTGLELLGLLIFIWAFVKLLNMFFTYLDRKQGNFTKEINPKNWPSKRLRTIKHTLTYMSIRSGLLAWDIFTGCVLGSFLLTIIVMGIDKNIEELERFVLAFPQIVIFFLVIRGVLWLYYRLRKYKEKMLFYCKKYLGENRIYDVTKNLEQSLKEDLYYYSPMWVITKDFFLAWCEADDLFHPIALPVKEMRHLKYEVRVRTVRRAVVQSAVIVCSLRNGNSVDLYVGNRFKTDVIWRVLRYFQIPFENTLTPREEYEEPFEITVTNPQDNNLKK